MVFESVIVDILNKYLKPYVKRLDSSQLNLGVWKGDVRVEKLELKEDIFSVADVDIPVRVKRSYVGVLEAHIPWKNLTKEPIEISIDEVYVILGPDLDTKYDSERELERSRKEKKKKIQEYHDAVKKKKQKLKEAKKGKKKKESEKPDTFAEKLAVHMTKNLQVKVRDIHVRYEDEVTNAPSIVAAGLTLHSLNLKSTDGNWVPCVVRETATLIYKLIELNCLGLYWNTTCVNSFASPELSNSEMIELMRGAIARPAVPPPTTNSYLLNPLSAAAKLKLNLKPGVDLSLPQILMDLECEDIFFFLQQAQLNTLLLTIDSYDRHVTNQKYLKYKPRVGVSEDPRAWWGYAIDSAMEEVKRKTQMWSWEHIKQHRSRVKLYVEKYREKLHSINTPASLNRQIQALEDTLDWFNILVYREEAAKKEKKTKKDKDSSSKSSSTSAPKGTSPPKAPDQGDSPKASGDSPSDTPTSERKVVESKRKSRKARGSKSDDGEKKLGFFARLKQRGSKSGDKNRDTGKSDDSFVVVSPGASVGSVKEDDSGSLQKPEKSSEQEEKDREKLYKAIGYSPDEEFVEYPKEYVAHEIHVLFQTLTLELLGQKEKLGVLETRGIKVDVLNRPTNESISVNASVGSLKMTGVSHPEGAVAMVTSDVSHDQSLIELGLEINPLDRPEMDVVVKAVLRPLQLTYDFDTVNELIKMFKPPNHIHFQELTNAASASWEQLKSQTSAGLEEALKDRKQVDLDITLHSPYLIVPENGHYTKDSHLILVDLGQLRVFGCTNPLKNLPKSITPGTDFSGYYDKFTISLEGMQVLVAKPGENWREAMTSGASPLHIIAPTGLEIQLLKSMLADDALLATVRIEGTLPGFNIQLTDAQLGTLIKVAATMEKPPALINTGKEYNELPMIIGSRFLLDDTARLVDMETVSIASSSMDDEELLVSPPTSPVNSISSALGEQLSGDVSKSVFTDAAINLLVQKVSVSLTKTVSKTSQVSLLDVIITDIVADVKDRKWDTQGSVSIKEVAVLDHITPDASGGPTYLLKTEALEDGNFISARFIKITEVGHDFAAKYTGLEDSLSAQLSLVKLRLHRSTVKGIMGLVNDLQPVLSSMKAGEEESDGGGLETISEEEQLPTTTAAVNLKDFETELHPIKTELHYNVQFAGIDITLLQESTEFLYADLTGFSVKGSAQPEKVTVNATIQDMSVEDKSLDSDTHTIVRKQNSSKSLVMLNVVQYNLQAHQRDPHNLSWVDTSLQADISRVNVTLHTNFLSNVLDFVKNLEIDKSSYANAAMATAETATITANAIMESTKSAHRLKLDLKLDAPIVELPYTMDTRHGCFYINLGEFEISNRIKHGHEVRHGSVDSDCSAETLTILGAQTVLDTMDIHTSSIQISRKSWAAAGECSLDKVPASLEQSESVLLEPLKFTASITRNISLPTRAFPNVDIRLNSEAIKLHMQEEDVKALISIGIGASRISEVLATPSKPPESSRNRAHTLLGSMRKQDTLGTVGRQRSRTRAVSRLKRFHTHDQVVDVRVEAGLESLTFDLSTENGPLLQAGANGLNTKVDVLKDKVLISASATSINVADISTGLGSSHHGSYRQVVSTLNDSETLSTLQLTIYTEEGRNPLAPLGKLQASIAQLQLFIPVPFVVQTVGFVQRLGVDQAMIQTASKTAQDGATAVSSVAQEKFILMDVKVHAPVLIVPTSQAGDMGVMVDLGALSLQNTLLAPKENVGVDAYGLSLSNFKISRVLLNPDCVSGSPVLTERCLLQPFQLLLSVERNLSPWYTEIPSVKINLDMHELKIFLGSDDLSAFLTFGLQLMDQIQPLLPTEEQPAPSIEDSAPSAGTVPSETTPSEDSPPHELLRIRAALAGIEVQLFRDEPNLAVDDFKSQDFFQLGDYSLTSLQLVSMEACVKMSSDQKEVEVKATMKDIALIDKQPSRQDRATGNRVIQHYTSNPLKAYTGQLDKPILSVQYVLRDEENIILFTAERLLILSDIEFLKSISDYFKAIFEPALNKSKKSETDKNFEETLKEETKKLPRQKTLEGDKKKQKMPKLKVNASIKDFRVAIIEDVDTPQPQALTLKLSTHVHVQLSELTKQVTVNVADLGISTSSFFDLATTTSWVLLPCSMSLSLSGPIDEPAMNIQAVVDPISLTLSPAIVRLIIHAASTLTPEKEDVVVPAPTDLWSKQSLYDTNLWFLEPVRLHKAVAADGTVAAKPKGEYLTATIESVEVYLESEDGSGNEGHPVLSLSLSAVIQVAEWTGELSLTGDIQCEASYYNENVSVWEPILEPVEDKHGHQHLWEISIKMDKMSPAVTNGSSSGDPPQFSLSLSAISPLQLTLTSTSLELIKNLAEAYQKEYVKQMTGNVNVDSLTGAPFTVVNKLGDDVPLFIQPGSTLKLKGNIEYQKLIYGDSCDLYLKRDYRKRSYASLVTQSKKEASTIDLAVGGNKFHKIKSVVIDQPGLFYYTLIPTDDYSDKMGTYGLVVEVAVTGEKKTITARSPIKFTNQLAVELDLFYSPPESSRAPKKLTSLKPEESYSIPLHRAADSDFFVSPTGFGFQSSKPGLTWLSSRQSGHTLLQCSTGDSSNYFIRAIRTEEKFVVKKNLPEGEFPHHSFKLHPPMVVHNLLPCDLYINHPSACIPPGSSEDLHYIDLDREQEISAMLVRPQGFSLAGKFMLKPDRKDSFLNFYASDKNTAVELSVNIEENPYLKLGLFCPFWMINKTSLTLMYKEGDKVVKHPPTEDIMLLSTSNKKNKIQLCAVTSNESRTDPSKAFSLSAIGSSGNFTCRLGEQIYKFGVEIRLSQFTLTKLVIVTPYYLIVNETKDQLCVHEETTPNNSVPIPPGQVVPFWPLTSGSKLVSMVVNDDAQRFSSVAFDYTKSDFTVLQFKSKCQLSAVCLEVQESESATIVTFSPYYPGCVPLRLINHFPDITIQFQQDSRSSQGLVHTLAPFESRYYTWDDPTDRRFLRWTIKNVGKVSNNKLIDISKDSQESFSFKPLPGHVSSGSISSSVSSSFRKGSSSSLTSTTTTSSAANETWLDIDENLEETLVTTDGEAGPIDDSFTSTASTLSSVSTTGKSSSTRGYWKCFIDGLQRVLVFTPDSAVLDRIKAENSYSRPLFDASLSLRSVGLSLVDNHKKRELAYIAITQSGIIWQLDKGKNVWKTVNTSLIVILEQAYQNKEIDVKEKNLSVNLETMEMYAPVAGKLRRTHHDGVFVKFSLSEKDYSVHAKIGYVQVDNQLPFSVYPQVLYPIPPPPTVASTTEPKPFIEASLILRKNDQSNGYHFKYVHVLIQKMAVNVDLGFILSLVDFFTVSGADLVFQKEYVEGDIEYSSKSLKETVVPELSEDFTISRSFFDVLHLAPIKVTLSFNIRSVGKNKDESEITAGDRLLQLFLHSIGVILTSVQETEMKFSVFHLEYVPVTGRGLSQLLIKHYRNQALFQIHTLIFGLDVLGNPVSVVRGVVDGAIDLFYEPIKGSVLGPEEFFEGLGLGLRSFFGAGVVGGITGASARITGAVGDVFAKLSFDNEFINKRQVQKAKQPKIGSKLGGFAKNLFEGVTGVVTQPVKGLQKEGAVGLLKGTGRGLVGLIVRPTGGLVDLASGTLDIVTRKTQIGNFEISDIRPPRFIGRNGIVRPFSPNKAIGTALLVSVDEGNFVETDYYHGHIEISQNPHKFILVTDRRFMLIERKLLTEDWKSVNQGVFSHMNNPVENKDANVVVSYDPKYKEKKITHLNVASSSLAEEIVHTVNESYIAFVHEQ